MSRPVNSSIPCPECSGHQFLVDVPRNEISCFTCGVVQEGISINEFIHRRKQENKQKPSKNIDFSLCDHIVPPKVDRKPSTSVSINQGITYNHKSPDYKSMRKAREFLGISKRSRAKIPLEQICPPFSKPHSTNTMDLSPSLYDKERGIQRGKERIRTNDVDAIIARLFWSVFANPPTRPKRKAKDRWASNEADWIVWELYVHLTLFKESVDFPKPWFISDWKSKFGLNDKFLKMGGPCNDNSLTMIHQVNIELATHPENNCKNMITGMLDLFEIFYPNSAKINTEDFAVKASEIYIAVANKAQQILLSPMYYKSEKLQFHTGELIGELNDGSQCWKEARHVTYPMHQIILGMAILQALHDENRLTLGASLIELIQTEVELFAEYSWSELAQNWKGLMAENDKTSWCE